MSGILSKKVAKVIPVWLILLSATLVSAGVLKYFVTIHGTVRVEQAVVFSDGSTEKTFSFDEGTIIAGSKHIDYVEVKNRAEVPATVKFKTSISGPGCPGDTCGITTSYWKVPDTSGIVIDGVISDGEWEEAETITVADNMGTVKVIVTPNYLYVLFDIKDSTDARNGENPHGNDQISININPTEGAEWGKPYDIIFQFGTDPTAWGGQSSGEIDGWETQWVINGEQEILPEDLELKTTYRGDGRKIVECKIPLKTIEPILDTLKVGGAIDIGDGNSYVYPQELSWSNSNTFADVTIGEKISEGEPFTIDAGETLTFGITNEFAVALEPGTYTITTELQPVEGE